jgi:quercetin dioxygenase-like cupin family protein
MSQLENGQCSVSLASLQRISTALEVPMFAFLESTPPPSPVMRANERTRLDISDPDICYELLSRDLGGQVMAIMIHVRPGGRRIAERLSQPTDEIMYVLTGHMSITVDEETYTLDPGDSICYAGRSLREFSALGDEEMQAICCVTPPVL